MNINSIRHWYSIEAGFYPDSSDGEVEIFLETLDSVRATYLPSLDKWVISFDDEISNSIEHDINEGITMILYWRMIDE